jgi:hypothetical protein
MGLRARRAEAIGSILAAVVLAGCASAVHLSGPAPPPPGHEAPASAVSGFVQHLMAGSDPVTTCGYVEHYEEGNCLETVSNASGGGTGTWKLGHSVVSGNDAVVAVELANVCFSSCSTNTNPNAGLPGHGLSFSAAFQHTQEVTGKKIYAFGCVRTDGRWYVELAVTGII